MGAAGSGAEQQLAVVDDAVSVMQRLMQLWAQPAHEGRHWYQLALDHCPGTDDARKGGEINKDTWVSLFVRGMSSHYKRLTIKSSSPASSRAADSRSQ